MTPQEKALDLYNRMIVDFTIDKWQSKQCALIAVNEIIDTIEYSSQADETSKIIYWDKVKEEIIKL